MAITKQQVEQKQQQIGHITDGLKHKKLDDQFKTDVRMWLGHIQHPNTAEAQHIVERLFITLYHGGLMYRPTKKLANWAWFGAQNIPTAAALSHGGRILIQLPLADMDAQHYDANTDHDSTFWYWLTGAVGRPAGMVLRIATHGVSKLTHPIKLPNQRRKYLQEEKGKSQSLAPRNIELFGNRDAHHRHRGINLALGGRDQKRITGVGKVEGDGSDGHLYIYYMAPKSLRYGAILVGCEGSAPGEYDQFGHKHDWRGSSSEVSPTGGLKWRDLAMGPTDAEDDMFIDLRLPSDMDSIRHQNFSEDCLRQPPLVAYNYKAAANTYIPTFAEWRKWTWSFFHSRGALGDLDGYIRQYENVKGFPDLRKLVLDNMEDSVAAYLKIRGDRAVTDDRKKAAKRLKPCIAQEKILMGV